MNEDKIKELLTLWWRHKGGQLGWETHPAWLHFVKEMESKDYDPERLSSAWYFFREGFNAMLTVKLAGVIASIEDRIPG